MTGINEVVESIASLSSSNAESIERIAEDLSTISARNEELSAALEEMTATVATICQETKGTRRAGAHDQRGSDAIREVADTMKAIENEVTALAGKGGEVAADRVSTSVQR